MLCRPDAFDKCCFSIIFFIIFLTFAPNTMTSTKNASHKTMTTIFLSAIVILLLLSLNFSAFTSISPSAASSASLRRQQVQVKYEFLPPRPTSKSRSRHDDNSSRFRYSADSEDVASGNGSEGSYDDSEQSFVELSSAVLNGNFNDDDDDDEEDASYDDYDEQDFRVADDGIRQDSNIATVFDDEGAEKIGAKGGKIAWLMR